MIMWVAPEPIPAPPVPAPQPRIYDSKIAGSHELPDAEHQI